MTTGITSRTAGALRGSTRVPGDKSVSHRAAMLSAIASGTSRIRGFLDGGDCRATLGALRALGVDVVSKSATEISVHGRGLDGPERPGADIDCGSSGTTMRLLAGLLAGQDFDCRLTGSEQLLGRPMDRVIDPLTMMGAYVSGAGGRAPLVIRGRRPLEAIDYSLDVASAQVKSCILLAGLSADGTTTVHEPGPARDHTERLLAAMGAPIEKDGRASSISPPASGLRPLDIDVPGDISSAAFLLVAAAIVPGSEIRIESVGVNPTRTGIIEALSLMGADIETGNARAEGPEPVADIVVRHSDLGPSMFEGDAVVTMIDEIPVLALAATQARGTTVIRSARELRTKETDRIKTTARELGRLGAAVTPLEDGLSIEGPTELTGCTVRSHGDHRLAMTLAVAGLVASGETTVRDAHVTSDSFPGFVSTLASLGAPVEEG